MGDLNHTAHTATAGDGGERVRPAGEVLTFSQEFHRSAVAQMVDDSSDGEMLARVVSDAGLLHAALGTGPAKSYAPDLVASVRAALAQAPAVQAPAGEDVALAKAITQACFDPGLLAGPRGDRTVDGWRADAVLSVLGALAASPTPTDDQPKAARPVGDEALRGALKDAFRAGFDISTGWWNAQEGCSPDSSDDFQMLQREAVNSIWSSLSAHPTTGQETVATPRDGGVREALRRVVLIQARELKRLDPQGTTPPDLDAAMNDLRVALSAPGSAGPGEPTDALVDRFSAALKAKLRASEEKYGWRNRWLQQDWATDCQRDLARHVTKGDPLDVAAYAAFCLHHGWPTATPSPAQEPGTGDTGERKHNIDRYPDAPNLRVNLSTGRLCSDPATTAETRGPAEGAR